MGVIEFMIYASIIGLIAWLVTTYLPMPDNIKKVIIIAAVIIVVAMLLACLGMFPIRDISFPRVVD